jgi:O-antigen ligase
MVLIGQGRTSLRAWAVGALGIGLLDLLSGGALSTRAVSLVGDYVVEQRAALMYAGVLMFIDHPWVGIGPGGFVSALQQYGPQIDVLFDYVGSAHNGYVEVAAEMGIIGVVGFVLLMGGLLRRLAVHARASAMVVVTDVRARERAQLDRALFWAFATACLITFTIWPFAHGMGQLLVLIAALGLAEGEAPSSVPDSIAPVPLPSGEQLAG